MASPVADSYSAASGVPVYGGRFPLGGRLSGEALLSAVLADGSMGSLVSGLSGEAVLTGVTADGTLSGETLPTWVPSTAWQWTNIPSSTWSTYMADDGSGIAPQITVADPGPSLTYQAQWDFSGPCYSRKNHEIWMFGGGHAGTTINAVTKWNLNQDSPTVSMASAPTALATRNTYLQLETWRTTAYQSDGKPSSPHSYNNNHYLDAIDEFISFGIAEMATGYPTASGGSVGSRDVAALQRAGTWRAENYYSDIPLGANAQPRGPRIPSLDGTAIWYWDGPDASNTIDLRKWVASTNTYSTIGASVIPYYSRQAEGGSGVALVMGGANSSAGWQAKFVTLSSGSTVDVTVSGDSIPTGLGCVGVTWCESFGHYVAVWVTESVIFSGGTLSAIVVATITPTGSATATASIKTMTGTAPTVVNSRGGVYFDPLFQAVVMVQSATQPVKVFKVN